MTPPFSDMGEAGVCARVAIALVKRTRVRLDLRDTQPLILIGICVSRLDGLHFGSVRLALLSLSVWVEQKKRSEEWLSGVLYRDLMGYPIRRCFHADYKATRCDPRVTNRGVTPRSRPPAANQPPPDCPPHLIGLLGELGAEQDKEAI
jgi:hypothetical protein